MSESRYEHLDRLIRAQLGDWEKAADALDDWLMRVHGTTTGLHNLGLLLDLLADAGYTVTPPGADLADLLADVDRYLTATHAVLGQHDQLGIGLSCHGCGLEQKVAAAVESGQPAEAITTEDHRG